MEMQFDRRGETPSISASRRNSYASTADDMFEGLSQGLSGIQEWTSWRTNLNSVMVDIIEERHRIFSYPKSKKHIKGHTRILKTLTEPKFAIGRGVSEFALSRAVHDYVHGDDGFHLDAESFLSFGIPRVKLCSNVSYSADPDSENPTSTSSSPATDGSVDLYRDQENQLETGSDCVVYSESSKKRSPEINNGYFGNTDLDSSASFTPTVGLDERGVYL